MKSKISFLEISLLLIILSIINGCTKNVFVPDQNNFLKQVKSDGYVVEQISYNRNNLVAEVNSTTFYRKFLYDNNNRLIKEEIAASSDMLSSSMPTGMTHEFVDPDKAGISMYLVYEYGDNGYLTRQLCYASENGRFEFRSMRTFEYNDNHLVSKVLLHDSDGTVTQFFTYQYDNSGNVIEENYFTFLFASAGTGLKQLSKTTFEYDSYFNPFKIFSQTASPGIYTNTNNIIRTQSISYEHSPGLSDYSESVFSYEYNLESGYPVKLKDGEEYIYD